MMNADLEYLNPSIRPSDTFVVTKMATILLELDRGATGLYAKGMYSGDEKCMLYCVVSKKQIVELKDIVASVDPDAFVIVSDVREVLG